MWEHIDSSYVKIGSDKIKPIEHRLYINCDSSITHLIMKEFIRKCNAVSSKYYFKYDIYADRSDTLVIYSDTKHLAFYIKLLNEIVNENNLSQGVHVPPLLTGRINSFIGYGSEPLNTGTSPISFNSKREIHLEKCIKAETADFIRKNFQRKIRCNNSLLLYKDYLIGKIISAAREDLLKYVTDTERIKYIKSEEFAIDLARKLAEKIDTILKYYKNNCTIQIQVPTEGNPLRISHTVIEDVLKTQIRIIFIKQETYKESLMQRIKDTAHEFDIDKDNYAVDISKSQLLGKDVEDDFDDSSSMQNETKQSEVEEKPKIKIKNFNYNAMTDEEIEESRKKIGIK